MTSMLMFGVLLLFAWPQQSPNASVSAQKTATAYFYMISGALRGAEITVDGRAVCRLQSRQYCTVQVGPGKHTIATNQEWLGNSFELESGKTYYFRLQVRAVCSAGYPDNVVPMATETAEVELRDCTRAGTDRI
ncbi:MAG TPA: DUF2846 domain-containing protein [Terriglobales bacterium]|nr:DUF2846 domain-containing protein [Terriglobales bacterium]